MSAEGVNQFLQKVTEDAQLQEELAAALQSPNRLDAVTQLGKRHGFEFTADEIKQEFESRESEFVARQESMEQAGELSDEELEAVAGGAASAIVSATVQITSQVLPVLTQIRVPSPRRW